MNLGPSNYNPYHHVGESDSLEENLEERRKHDAYKARHGNPFCFLTEYDAWFYFSRIHNAGVPEVKDHKYWVFKDMLKKLRRQLHSDERGAVQRLEELKRALGHYTKKVNARDGHTMSGSSLVDKALNL